MCGIIGILGNHEAAPIIVDALRRLEYRGYDSAGLATVNKGGLDCRRAMGKLVNLSDHLVHEPLAGKAGIGHTRWATHGTPSVRNAHPHRAGRVAVVHNGIIENHSEIYESLRPHGVEKQSETDTEIVALLVERKLDEGLSPSEAVQAVLPRLKGAFALAFLFDGHDNLILAARRGSPLAIGYGDNEMFLGSDAIALAPLTRRIAYLEEGDFAEITRAGARIFNEAGNPVERKVQEITINNDDISKNGHKHYMAKEIHEQPTVIRDAIAAYTTPGAQGERLLQSLKLNAVERIVVVACGTAFYAGLAAKYWLERLAGVPVEVDVASEFRYREPPICSKTLAIFVSQSGETADTLAALRYAKTRAHSVVSVVNVPTSSIARESDVALPSLAGTEIGVASTKAFTCQLTVLFLLSLSISQQRGRADIEADLQEALTALPIYMSQVLDNEQHFADISRHLAEASDVLFIGRGLMYPLALEGALKLKEISYIHAEAYAAGELKHGPLALVDAHVPVVVMAPKDALFEKTLSNVQEVIARDGKVVFLSDSKGFSAAGSMWQSAQLPAIHPLLTPILYALPAQLLAYHTAVAKGTDVDQPRNLAKSVTVE